MPRVALVAYDVRALAGEGRIVLETIRRADGSVDWSVVATHVDADVRELVRWLRVPVPVSPYRLRAVLFLLASGLRLLGLRRDLLHVAGPLVAARADLVSIQFLRAAFYDAIGARHSVVTKIHLALERWMLGRARALAVPSGAMRREVERRFPGKQVFVVPNGVDLERYRPDPEKRSDIRAEFGVPEGRTVALFVGNAFGQKGLAVAIAAVARADADLELWVVGYGDWDKYRAVAAREGVEARVRHFGIRRDLDRLYRGADLLVLPSAFEVFPLVTLEAAASGLPVVATRVGGMDELLGDGRAGILVERDPDSVGEALATLAADPARRAAMGAAGRERAERFTWERTVSELLAAYDALLAA